MYIEEDGLKEREIIAMIREAFPDSGIGDDAAVLGGVDGDMLFAVDAVVQDVHFKRAFSTLSQAVQKAVSSNVSDIYAMGGHPCWIVLSAGLPNGCDEDDIGEIIDGLKRATGAYGLTLVGGDTIASPGGFFFDVAIAGSVEKDRAVRRCGAEPGDAIVLLGECGGSRAGMLALSAAGGSGEAAAAGLELSRNVVREIGDAGEIIAMLSTETTRDDIVGACAEKDYAAQTVDALTFIKRHLVPFARPAPPALLTGNTPRITAMIDVSDGIARDLRTLCSESGVGAVIEENALPVPGGFERLFSSGGGLAGLPVSDFVLSSGEEYVLLASVRGPGKAWPQEAGTVIGSVVPAEQGITIVRGNGKREPLTDTGYEHDF
jgi:thiamine-monophosphate kinase